MEKSDVLFYERDFTKPKVDSNFFEEEAYLQSKKRIGQWLYKEILKKPIPDFSDQKEVEQEDWLNQWLRNDTETPNFDDFFMDLLCDHTGNEVVLPCPEQTFLRLLKRATVYTEAFNGTIRLLRHANTLVLLIKAPYLCLNHANIRFFSDLLMQCFNIDFLGDYATNVTMWLYFNDVGPDTKTVDLDTLRKLLTSLNEA